MQRGAISVRKLSSDALARPKEILPAGLKQTANPMAINGNENGWGKSGEWGSACERMGDRDKAQVRE